MLLAAPEVVIEGALFELSERQIFVEAELKKIRNKT